MFSSPFYERGRVGVVLICHPCDDEKHLTRVAPSCPGGQQCHIFVSEMLNPDIIMANDPDRVGDGNDGNDDTGVGLATRTRTRTKEPTLYRVLMLNDDYTPMEFVVLCLQRFFRMTTEEATRVMFHVHQKGVGVCGVFSYEVAETKVSQVIDFARQNQHPLQCTLEKA